MPSKFILSACSLLLSIACLADNKRPVTIYVDADNTHTVASTESIVLGINAALADNRSINDDLEISLKVLDHRGNSARSKANFKRISNDPTAIAIYTGMHSPPLIKNRTFNNSLGIPIFVPWAAGGPITRLDDGTNFTFRLSIDDSQVGEKLIDFALNKLDCATPQLMLEDTGWGRSNQRSMTKALKDRGREPPKISWFGWDEKEASIRVKVDQIAASEPTCIMLVANASEGAKIVRVLHQHLPTVPIVSHWGITGSNFIEQLSPVAIEDPSLYVVQTCFAFTTSDQDDVHKQAAKTLLAIKPELKEAAALNAPVGFIHAYDLTRLMLQALASTDHDLEISALRDQLRQAMYRQFDYQGLIKNYTTVFTPNTQANDQGHEALSSENYCMAEYEGSRINIIEKAF